MTCDCRHHSTLCCGIGNSPYLFVLVVYVLLTLLSVSCSSAADFNADVRPILVQHCLSCHGSQKQEGGLRLDQRAAAMRGGDGYAPAIMAKSSDTSPLFQFVSREDADLQMPPKGPRLSAAEIQLLKEWIDAGAEWPDSLADIGQKSSHWSFQPLVRPEVPERVVPSGQGQTGLSVLQPIDAFVQGKLAEQKLTPNPPADRRTLIRRLSFDLLGIPPSPEEVAAFEADADPLAYEKLVDRYLALPQFGERAARFWLDTVRFAESDGFETNQPRPNAWRYRDYVINAFNSDLPYDQFVKQQLAGDQLGVGAATGFIVGGAWDRVKSPDPILTAQQRADELHDMVSTTGSVFLGLTVGCARCHSHKFDPIPQTDYYAMKAVFEGVMHGEREIEVGRPAESQQRAIELQEQLAVIDSQLREFEPLASLRETVFVNPTDMERTVHLHATPTPAIARGAQRGASLDPGEGAHWPNLSAGYLYWKLPPQTDAFGWKPKLTGTYRFWTSWGCGHVAHSTDARYLLDRDGDLKTTDDQREILRANHQRFADASDLIPEQPLWSGLKDAGVVDLLPESVLVVRQGDQDKYVTVDVAVFQSVPPDAPAEGRPALRVPVTRDLNVDRFAPVLAKHLRFTVRETSGAEPCIDELEVFASVKREGEAPAEPLSPSGDLHQPRLGGSLALPNIALAIAGTKSTASGTYPNSDIHKLEHLNDGLYGNSKSWISNEAGRGWVQLEFTEAREICEVRWSRDRAVPPQYADRLATQYTIETSLDGQTWNTVATSVDRLPYGMTVPGGRLIRAEGADAQLRFAELQTRRQTVAAELAPLIERPRAYAGQFVNPPVPTYRLNRGDVSQPKEVVAPASLSELGTPVQLPADAQESQRRMALAEWMVSRDNPLTARVIVNRLWQQHFGEGIVETPSDLGANGGKPTHPELLNWLACELMEPTVVAFFSEKERPFSEKKATQPWSLKHIHRLICLSDTYRQSSEPREDGVAVDAGSRLLWRYPPRRMEAEAIRDAILTVSGQLDPREGGPGFDLFEANTNYVKVYNSKRDFVRDDFRRMVYQSKPRMQLEDTFGTFDCPDAGQVTPKRTSSTTALQALSLLNSPFLLQQSQAFAVRVEQTGRRQAGSLSHEERVDRAFQLAFGRSPTAEERVAAVKLVDQHGLPMLCRALYNTHEFVTVR